MAFAATAGGVFNLLASLVVFRMPGAQVNTFDTALAALAIFGTPALGIQAAFAAQAALADDPQRLRALAAMMRSTFAWLGLAWALLAGLSVLYSNRIAALYNLGDPIFLWIILALVLLTLWTPIFNGVLQGRQDFLWYGFGTLLNGAGRLWALAVVVFIFKLGALGGLLGVLAGNLAVFGLVVWRTFDVPLQKGAEADWRGFLKKAIPLTLGLGALVTIMQADALVVRERLLPSLTLEETVGYTAARRIGQVLVFLVGAVVTVMYPKVARGIKTAEGSDALKLTVSLTTAVSVLGALLTSLVPQIPLRILAGSGASAESATLVVAYVWAFVPLAISNVLVWNLMARECYRSVPFIIFVAGGCWFALRIYSDRLLNVVAVVGVFSTAMLVVSGIFTVLDLRKERPVTSPLSA